jgi:hypothetical protein
VATRRGRRRRRHGDHPRRGTQLPRDKAHGAIIISVSIFLETTVRAARKRERKILSRRLSDGGTIDLAVQKRGLLTSAEAAVGGGGVGGVLCRYVSATVMFCLRELIEAVTTISIRMIASRSCYRLSQSE